VDHLIAQQKAVSTDHFLDSCHRLGLFDTLLSLRLLIFSETRARICMRSYLCLLFLGELVHSVEPSLWVSALTNALARRYNDRSLREIGYVKDN
jgi:hypothetical protein